MDISWASVVSAVDFASDTVRSALPLPYRQVASNWLVFSGIFAAAAILLGVGHLAFRERPKIAWNFDARGFPMEVGARLPTIDAPWQYYLGGIIISGENVSGHDLHQVDAQIELRNGNKLPLYVIASGAFRPLAELEKVPPQAMLQLGAQFSSRCRSLGRLHHGDVRG
jgi:hypothetical protein